MKHDKAWCILIADDQKRTRESLRALLNATFPAPEIWEAGSGREAVRLAEERQPDLILMDVRMPEGDGLEATRTIKSRWPGIRIVVLSMYLAYREEARAAGADAFVSKGEPPERLLAVLREQQPGGGPVEYGEKEKMPDGLAGKIDGKIERQIDR